MKKSIALLSILTLVSATAFAADSGVLGKRYANAAYSSVDTDGYNPSSFEFGANLPIQNKFDVKANLAILSGDNTTDFAIKGNAVYYFPQDAMYTPFVSGDLGINLPESGDSELSIGATAGVQLEVNDKQVAKLAVSITSVDSDTDTSFSGSYGYWVTEKALVELNLATTSGDSADSTSYGVSGKFLF
jgi:hypothetical protein